MISCSLSGIKLATLHIQVFTHYLLRASQIISNYSLGHGLQERFLHSHQLTRLSRHAVDNKEKPKPKHKKDDVEHVM